VGSALLSQGNVRKKKIRILVVNAPMSMGGDSYAWWPLDMQQLMMRMFTVGVGGLFKGPKPKEVTSTTAAVAALIEAQAKETKIPLSKTVLCGFSQGSWLSTNLALGFKEMPAALVLFSSALYLEEWKKKAPEKKGMKVMQFHGTQDPILPLQQGQMLK
jgi:phospholipase/carboxylesterase